MIQLEDSNVYADGFVAVLGNGDMLLKRNGYKYKPNAGDVYVNVLPGQELDFIAYKYYQDQIENPEKYWWLIADANGIINPLDLASFEGKTIVIPDINFAVINRYAS